MSAVKTSDAIPVSDIPEVPSNRVRVSKRTIYSFEMSEDTVVILAEILGMVNLRDLSNLQGSCRSDFLAAVEHAMYDRKGEFQ